jgi:hypothetical protein
MAQQAQPKSVQITSGALPPLPLKHMALTLAVPGLGHLLARRFPHAAIFGLSSWALLITGLLWSNMTAIDQNGHPVYFVMQLAAGVVVWVIHFGGLAPEVLIGENVTVTNQMIGVCYVAVAGVLNFMGAIELARHGVAPPAVITPDRIDGQTTGGTTP